MTAAVSAVQRVVSRGKGVQHRTSAGGGRASGMLLAMASPHGRRVRPAHADDGGAPAQRTRAKPCASRSARSSSRAAPAGRTDDFSHSLEEPLAPMPRLLDALSVTVSRLTTHFTPRGVRVVFRRPFEPIPILPPLRSTANAPSPRRARAHRALETP
jgi:hypothetical protein